MNLTWTSPYQTHEYEPLYLANGTFGGMLDLSGTNMDLWSAECGAASNTTGSDGRLWPVTAIRLQAFYRNSYWKQHNFWIGRTGIHCDDPSYLINPSMPHMPQVYGCRQELDLDAGLAMTGGTLYPGSQAALEAGLAPERAIPFESRLAFLKDSTLMGMEIVAAKETEILILPETLLEEVFAIRNSAKGITTLGNGMDCQLTLRKELLECKAEGDTIRFRIQPNGDAPYSVIVRCPDATIEHLAGQAGLLARGRAFCLVEILPEGKAPHPEAPLDADSFFQEQARRWEAFWSMASVTLPESASLWRERYRTSLYYIAQSMTDGASQPVGMSKPMLPYWHGCFHDTDTYFARPMLETGHFAEARRHLDFRLRTLDSAKQAASRHNRSGALYPWQADPKGNGEIIDVPMNNAIIAVEAWHQFLHNRNEDDRQKAGAILAEVFRNLLDHVDLEASPMQPKPEPLMTFSEVMTATDPTEFRLALRAVAGAVVEVGVADASLTQTAQRVLDELHLPEDRDGSIAFSTSQDPLYARVGSVTLGSFPLHCLAPEPGLRKAFDRELARQLFLFAWLPYQMSVVASQLQVNSGPTSAAALMRQADTFFKGPWHAFDEWENRRTARAAIFVTSAGGFCTALHHLLLAETAPGVWSLWPGVPDEWKELSFTGLHTRAGWRVSAVRKDGQTTNWQAEPVNKNATGEFQLDTGGAEGVVKLMRSDYSFGA
jgi:hypothetical protein